MEDFPFFIFSALKRHSPAAGVAIDDIGRASDRINRNIE
jgi:hypothetical protein